MATPRRYPLHASSACPSAHLALAPRATPTVAPALRSGEKMKENYRFHRDYRNTTALRIVCQRQQLSMRYSLEKPRAARCMHTHIETPQGAATPPPRRRIIPIGNHSVRVAVRLLVAVCVRARAYLCVRARESRACVRHCSPLAFTHCSGARCTAFGIGTGRHTYQCAGGNNSENDTAQQSRYALEQYTMRSAFELAGC